MANLLNNTTALVTAGTSGLGRAFSTAFAEHGAAVAIHYRSDRDGALALAESIRAGGGRSVAVHADLRDAEATRAAFREAESALGPLNVLINNASVYVPPNPVETLAWDEMQTEFEGSVQTAFNATKAALPGMLERRNGRILFLIGTMVQRPASGYAAHTAGKGALLAFASTLAKEAGPRGIRVHCISPGMALTPNVLAAVPLEAREALRVKTPTRSLPTPEELAGLAVFLASPLSSSATLLHLNADGGLADMGA
ncbi:MAG TPA: SDR family oxidoreductase [Armatimonadota bacterium]|jgi:3-oxoacyl-[acyl-carrier protein] reductase